MSVAGVARPLSAASLVDQKRKLQDNVPAVRKKGHTSASKQSLASLDCDPQWIASKRMRMDGELCTPITPGKEAIRGASPVARVREASSLLNSSPAAAPQRQLTLAEAFSLDLSRCT